LKNEIQRLISKGYLQHFMKKNSQLDQRARGEEK
jgi:hypothetical protein